MNTTILGQKISGKKAKNIIDKGNTVLIDIRSPVSYRDGALPNAVNMSLRMVSSLLKLPKTMNLIFYGTTNEDEDLRAAVNYVVQLGFTNVFSLGAKDNWDK